MPKNSVPLQLLLALLIAGFISFGATAGLPPGAGQPITVTGGALAAPLVPHAPGPPRAQQAPSPDELFGLNNLGTQEQEGVRLEVVRVVIGRKDQFHREGRNLAELGRIRGDSVIGELILKVTNTSNRKVDVAVDEGMITLNDEQISYRSGDENAGFLLPGGMRITSHLFVISRSSVMQVRQMLLHVERPVDEQNQGLGEDFVLSIDLSRRGYEPRTIRGRGR